MPDLIKRTQYPYPTFTQLTFYRTLRVADGVIEPVDSIVAVKGAVQILGDEAGIPIQELPGKPGEPQFTATHIDLSEEVIRANGAKLTVRELLAEIVLAS